MYAADINTAKAQCTKGATASATALRIQYAQCDRHAGGSNYTFADGHAKWYRVEATLNPTNFLWGKRVYSQGNATIFQANGTTPVN